MVQDSGYDCTFLTDCLPADRVRFDREAREAVAADEGPHPERLPDAVVYAHATEEVSATLAAANERGVPVTPRSGGSSIEGNPIPVEGGIVLSTVEMDDATVRPEDFQAVVGPGITYDDLNDLAGDHGLRFAPGIAAGHLATIGGMIANDASGLNAVRYGVTGDHVLRLEVVLPDGRVIECGRDVVKTTAGYNLKDLFVGSEGTLGVVTEATLSLEPVPAEKRAALVTFPSREHASRAVTAVMGAGITPGAIEFVDERAVEMINESTGVGLRETHTLVIELHGSNSGIEETLALVRERCESAGATDWAEADGEDIDRIWLARREAYPAACEYRDDWDVAVIGDVVVPISEYPEIVARVDDLAAELDVPTPCVGHAGDGNLHYLPLADPDDEDSVERAMELNDRVIEAALDLGGTSTGEHGIGIGKRKFMRREHAEAVDVMAGVKEAIDPNGIMNPGKVIPDEEDLRVLD